MDQFRLSSGQAAERDRHVAALAGAERPLTEAGRAYEWALADARNALHAAKASYDRTLEAARGFRDGVVAVAEGTLREAGSELDLPAAEDFIADWKGRLHDEADIRQPRVTEIFVPDAHADLARAPSAPDGPAPDLAPGPR